jgi:hypothetical protein
LSKPFGMETFLNVVIAATMQSKETAGSKQTRATQYM